MLNSLVGMHVDSLLRSTDVKDVADGAAELAKGVDYRKRFEQEEDKRFKQMKTTDGSKWLPSGQR